MRIASLIITLGGLFFADVKAQEIWSDDFSTDLGWIIDTRKCDGNSFTMGIVNGEFRWQDVEGDCCPNDESNSRTGRNNSILTSPNIDLQAACQFTISFDYTWGDQLECYNPARSKDSCSNSNFGQDQFWFEYRLDGGDWIRFFSFCESGAGSRSFTSSVISRNNTVDLNIRIAGGVQATDEWFTIDNVRITNEGGGLDISVPDYELCLTEDPITLPAEIDGVSGVWTNPAGAQITEIDPSTYINGMSGVTTATFNPMGACTNQSTYTVDVNIVDCTCPLYRVELVRNESLDALDCSQLSSYRRNVEYRIIGEDGGLVEWFIFENDSISFAGMNSPGAVPYPATVDITRFAFPNGVEDRPVLLVIDRSPSANCNNGEDSIYIQFPPFDFTGSNCTPEINIDIDNVRCNTESTQSLGDDQIVFDLTIGSIQSGSCDIEITDRNNNGPQGPLPISTSRIEFNQTTQVAINIGSNQLVRPQLRAFDLNGNDLSFSNINDPTASVPNPHIVVFDDSSPNSFKGISNVQCDTNGTSDPSDDILIFDIAATGLYGSPFDENREVFNGHFRLNLISPEVSISSPADPVFELTEFSSVFEPKTSEVRITLDAQEWPQDIFLSVFNDTIASCEKILTVQNACAQMDMSSDTSTMNPNGGSDSLLISVGSCSNDTFFYRIIDSTCSQTGGINGFLVWDTSRMFRGIRYVPDWVSPNINVFTRPSNDTIYFDFVNLFAGEYQYIFSSGNCIDTFSFMVPSTDPDLLTFDPTYSFDCDSAYFNFNFTGNSANAEFLILTNFQSDTLKVDSSGAFAPEPPYLYSFMLRDRVNGCQTELKNLNGNPTPEIYSPPFYQFDIMPHLTCVMDQEGNNQKQLNYSVSPVDRHAPAADSFRLYTTNGEIDQWFNISDGLDSFIVSPVFSSDVLFLADANGCFISTTIDTSVSCNVECNLKAEYISDDFDCQNGGQFRFELLNIVAVNVFVSIDSMPHPDSLVSISHSNMSSTIVDIRGVDTGDVDITFSLDPLRRCTNNASLQRVNPPLSSLSLFILDTLECERWSTSIDVIQTQGTQRELIYSRIDNNGENIDNKAFSDLVLFDTIDFQLRKEPDSLFITVQDTGRFCPYTAMDTIVFDKPKRINFATEPTLICNGPSYVLSIEVDSADYGFDRYWLVAEDGNLNLEVLLEVTQQRLIVVDSLDLGASLRINLLNANMECQDYYQFDELPDCDSDCGLIVDKTLTVPQCVAERALIDWNYVLPAEYIRNTNPDTSDGFVIIYQGVRSDIFPYESPVPILIPDSKELMPGDVIYIEDELNPDCRDSIIIGELENCCESVIYPSVDFSTIADTCSRGVGIINFVDISSDRWKVNWSMGLEQWDSMLRAENVVAGMYTAMVTNTLEGCDSVLTFEITVANASSLDVNATVVAHPSSQTSTDGVIRVGCSDCNLPYTIEINGMTFQVNQRDTVFQNLTAGTYPILVTDGGADCEYRDTLVLDPEFCDKVRASIVIEETHPATADGNFRDGVITITCPLCPNGEFEVFLNGTTEGMGMNGVYVINMLADGIYDLAIIVDANCSIDTMFEVTRCESYNTDRTVIQPTCDNLLGQIILSDLPPNPVITINGLNRTGDIFDSLSAGQYIIVVDDTVLSDICYPNYVDTVVINAPSNYTLGMGNTQIEAGQSITLTANDPGIEGFTDYYWALDGVPICNAPCLTAIVTPTAMSTTYEFVINSNEICNGPFNVTITLRDPSAGIEAPNTFNRGDISRFYILDNPLIIEVIETFSVYSRWGNQLFQNSNIPARVSPIFVGLDFSKQEQFNPNETYTYHIKARLTNGQIQHLSGTFIILE